MPIFICAVVKQEWLSCIIFRNTTKRKGYLLAEVNVLGRIVILLTYRLEL